MAQRTLAWSPDAPYRGLMGVGAIGTGMFFALEGDRTLGRNESRPAQLLDVRDYCKLHIIAHYVAVLLGAAADPNSFHVLPIGKIGEDTAGHAMLREMDLAGMDVRAIQAATDRPTTFSVCFQYPDGSGGNITTSNAAATALADSEVDFALGLLRAPGDRYIALAAPEVPLALRRHFLRRSAELGAFRAVCLTSADAVSEERHDLLALADLVAMNEDEASALIGRPFQQGEVREFLDRCADLLRGYQRSMSILLSAGRLGAFAFDGRDWTHRPAPVVPVASSAGAGDALLAGVLSALAIGVPLAAGGSPGCRDIRESALDLGVTLASFTVMSPHTIHPGASLDALLVFARQYDSYTCEPAVRKDQLA